MKTAEEWIRDCADYNKTDIPFCEDLSPQLVKQIQLDAMKEGMQIAADEALPKTKREYLLSESACRERILARREQLTEKDVV